MLAPGAMCPPLLMATAPAIEPVPPSVPPLLTITGPLPVPLPEVLFTSSVPAETVVPPMYVLPPDGGASVKTPEPVFVSPPTPLMTPLNAVELSLPPVVSVLALRLRFPPDAPPPASEPMTSFTGVPLVGKTESVTPAELASSIDAKSPMAFPPLSTSDPSATLR